MTPDEASGTESSQEDSTQGKGAMTLNYLRYTRLLLMSVGSWPGTAKIRTRRITLFSIYLFVEGFFLIWGEVQFLVNHFHVLSFYTLGSMYITLFLTIMVLYRAVLACYERYGTITREFVMKFHLIHFKHKNKDWQTMYESVNRVSYVFTMFIMVLSMSGVVSFNITPFYRNYQLGLFSAARPENITKEYSVYYEYPGFKQDDFFLACTVANVLFSYITAYIICVMDLLVCLMIFQIIGHIKMLVHTLRQFPKPQSSGNGNTFMAVNCMKFDETENEVIKNIIAGCITHHRVIVSFTEELSSFFGPMLAYNYLYQMFSFSLLLVECMQGKESLMRYGPLTTMTFGQLLQLSITFEIVGTESEKLKDEVYYLPWESMDISNQKKILFFLKRVQTPIQVTAMGMMAVGVNTMGKILKTSLSYCAFLSSIE